MEFVFDRMETFRRKKSTNQQHFSFPYNALERFLGKVYKKFVKELIWLIKLYRLTRSQLLQELCEHYEVTVQIFKKGKNEPNSEKSKYISCIYQQFSKLAL